MSARRVIVIGGGIVGLATAWRLQRVAPGVEVVVLEKENRVGAHQSGHNSGVIHSGIYYRPGSMKAQTCRRGREMLLAFCAEHSIRREVCGKVIVALGDDEVARLEAIRERGEANGVECERIDGERLREIEPHAAGVAALRVPGAGIVDFPGVCARLSELISAGAGRVVTGARVVGARAAEREAVVETTAGAFTGDALVNCAGLYSDSVARMAGAPVRARIVPFRGEYYELAPEAEYLCRNLIYPVPDPRFPFLGVHFTRMVGGGVECGPNAVLALAREGYAWSRVNAGELGRTLGYPGFWRLSAKHWRTGIGEVWRSVSKAAFVRALQRLMPEVTSAMLRPGGAGVRAQAVTPDGGLVDDFLVETHGRGVHVLNAPSPAATSSLAIGERVAGMVLERLA